MEICFALPTIVWESEKRFCKRLQNAIYTFFKTHKQFHADFEKYRKDELA